MDRDGRKAGAAGSRPSIGDLPLNHQRQDARAGLRLQQLANQGACQVVRDVPCDRLSPIGKELT